MRLRSVPPVYRMEHPVSEDERIKDEDWPVNIGDKVQFKRGKLAGKIVEVLSKQYEINKVGLSESPTKVVVVPKDLWQEGQTSHVVMIPTPVKLEDIRLVATIEGDGGKMEQVAIENVQLGEKYWDPRYGKFLKRRYVFGDDSLEVPWPNPPETEASEIATQPEELERRSYFTTSIIKPPFPQLALKDFRNPYSKYDKPKVTQDILRKLTPPKMPLSETRKAYLKEREEWRERAKDYKLTDEIKEHIGAKVIAHSLGSQSELKK